MLLHSLCSGPNLEVYYDSVNDWLFADWLGELTLPAVQQACLELIRCYQHHACSRILNNNMQVTAAGWEVPAWLGRYFLAHASEVGISHLAWVCSPSVRGQAMAQEAVSWVSTPVIALFSDVEDAVAWLQHTQRELGAAGVHSPSPAAAPKLAKLVRTLDQLVHTTTPPPW